VEAARAAHQARTTAATHLATFATAAGAAAGSTAEQIVAAIRGGSSEVATLATQVRTLETQIAEQRTATLQREATAEVDAAIKDGAPILTLRDHYIARFQREPDAVRKELAGLPRLNGAGNRVTPPPAPGDETVATLSAVDRSVAGLMGTDPAKLVQWRKKQAALQTDGRAA
jgi:hypothetical protein